MENIKRFFRSGLFSFKGLFGFLQPKIYILVKVINPIFMVIFFSLIASHAYNTKDITPWVIGNAFVLCMYNAFFGVGTELISERSYGTLKILIASPAHKFTVLLSKTTFHIVDSLITVLIGLMTGYILFNAKIPVNTLPLFFLLLLAAMFSACTMGLFIGSIGLITRDINLLLNISSMMLMALSGVNYPIDKLPIILQKINNIMPLTHALKGARMLINNDMSQIYSLLSKELIVGISYSILSYFFLKLMERLARRKATLDIF